MTIKDVKKGDIHIQIESENDNTTVELTSPSKLQFGKQIENLIKETVKKCTDKNYNIVAIDNGAYDYIIKSRVEYAVFEHEGISDIDWRSLLWKTIN